MQNVGQSDGCGSRAIEGLDSESVVVNDQMRCARIVCLLT